MRILAVETATSRQCVAVLENDHVLASTNEDTGRSHAGTLVPAIRALLDSLKLDLNKMDAFAVSIGPGSFTGLRVGLATVAAFRAVTAIPIVPVPTLEAMAWNLRQHQEPLCPVLPSRAGEVYWAVYQWNTDTLHPMHEVRVGPCGEMLAGLKEPTACFGPGFVQYREVLEPGMGALRLPVPEAAHAMSAIGVGLAARGRFEKGQIAGLGLAPEYVQAPAAVGRFNPSTKYSVLAPKEPS